MAQLNLETNRVEAPETVRLTVAALALITLVMACIFATHLEFQLRSAHMAMSNLPLVVLLPFVWWLLTNSLLKRFLPRFSLRTLELRVIFSALWAGGSFAGYNWATQWVGTMAAPRYYASPENRWVDLIFEYLPWWMYPVDAPGVVDRFYTGLHAGESLPWGAWLGPLFWALSASLAMAAIGMGVTAIFQRQWAENERLTFPLAQVPMALTKGFDQQRSWPPFMKSWMFWIGFAVAALPILFNIIEYFVTGFPRLGIFDAYYGPSGPRGASVSRYLGDLSYRLLPTVIGFTYLCDLHILFSIWSLYLVGLGAQYGMTRVGFSIGLGGQEAKTAEIGGLFTHGVMIGLVVWSIWVSRGHLKRVWHQVLHPVDPSKSETVFVSARWAVGALIGGGLFMWFWLHAAGYGLFMAAVWLVLFWIGIFAVMKFLSASGFGYLFPNWGHAIPIIMAGTNRMSESTLVAMRVVNWRLLSGWRLPATLPHLDRLIGRHLNAKSFIFGCVGVGVITSAVYTIWLCYDGGGAVFRTWSLVGAPIDMYDGIAKVVTETSDRTVTDPAKIGVWVLGIGAAVFMTIMQSRVPWWPLHPLGAMLMFDGYVRLYVLCIFLVWLSKQIVLRLGGIGAYRRTKPLSYGLIVGYVFAVGVSFGVDMIFFPSGGHYVHGY
jgi:hypothetical protein